MTKLEDRNRNFAAAVSLVVSTLLMFFKFWAHNKTGSEAIYSDAVESIINVTAAALALFVVYYAAKPADEDHPYGHGKVEYFSSAFEGGLISFASVLIGINAIRSLMGVHELRNLDFGLYVVLGTGIANSLLGVYLLRQGKKHNSVALSASGHHVISDSVTSAGVGFGVLLIYLTGWVFLDGVIAIIVGAYLGYTGLRLAKQSIGSLMDAEDLEVLKQLAQVFEKSAVEGIIQLHHVKVIRSGHYHHIDAHAVLPQFWDVDTVHEKIQRFEKQVIENYSYGGEMNFHIDPCRQVYCSVCDLKGCAIRREEFKKRIPVEISQLRSRDEPDQYR